MVRSGTVHRSVHIYIYQYMKESKGEGAKLKLFSENAPPVESAEILGKEKGAEAVGSGIYPKENRVYAVFTEACHVFYSM
jgi:hypothetical protein